MNAVIYARFSPRPNSDECDSVQKQVAELKEYAQKHCFIIKGIYTDEAMSGCDARRVGLWDALYSLGKDDTLLIRSWDRLARDTYLMEVIKKKVADKKARILSTTQTESCLDTPEAKLIQVIFSAIADYQRMITKARTRAMMKKHQFGGRLMSFHPPYGFTKDNKVLVRNEAEQKIIQSIVTLRTQGRTLGKIRRDLKALGFTTRKGTDFTPSQISKILERETYNKSQKQAE